MVDAMTATINALTGERIRLRELRDADLADLVSWWQDPDVMVTQTSGPFHPRPAEPIANQFRTWNSNAGTDAGFTVVTRDEGTVLGHVTLFGADAHNRTATFAIIIGPPHQGQGYGLETTRLTVRYGFTELGLHRIWSWCVAENVASARVLEKVGMRQE